nr:hypothetical protein BgiMline_031064 [Biomphalaria glabrata]
MIDPDVLKLTPGSGNTPLCPGTDQQLMPLMERSHCSSLLKLSKCVFRIVEEKVKLCKGEKRYCRRESYLGGKRGWVVGKEIGGRESWVADKEVVGSRVSDKEVVGSWVADKEVVGSRVSDKEVVGSWVADKEVVGSRVSDKEVVGRESWMTVV